MKQKARALVAFVIQLLGLGYIFGEYFARIITEEIIQAKAKQYPRQYTPKYVRRSRKWIGKLAGDCSGLIKAFFMTGPDGKIAYSAAFDRNSTSLMRSCPINGPITSIPLDRPGLLVFAPGHVGVYIGDGWVVEARGVDYGVVKTRLSERPWQSWGELEDLDYSEPVEPAARTYTVCAGDSPWRVAAEQLGDGRRYLEIIKLNSIPAPYMLRTGQVLQLPESGVATGEASTVLYVVRKGDSPWSIAKAKLGDGRRYIEIERLNDLDGDYDINAGDVLMIPAT